MKLKDFVAVVNNIDEFDIYSGRVYHATNKQQLLEIHGEDIVEDVFIEVEQEGNWIIAHIYLQ